MLGLLNVKTKVISIEALISVYSKRSGIIWKDIEGYEGVYKVSSKGKIYSVRNKRNLKLNYKKNGYVYVELNYKGKAKTYRVHRLVAKAFVYNAKNKPYVNHINGVKSDNYFNNLEWVSARENNIHAHENKLSGVQLIIYNVYDKYGKFIKECYGQDEVLKVTGIKSKQTVKDASEKGYITQSGHYIEIKERSTTMAIASTLK